MKMKKIIALLLALVMVLALAACGAAETGKEAEKETETSEGGKLVFSSSFDYPPYEFIYVDDDGNQQYAGIDVDIAQAIADDLGMELEIVNMSFENLMAALQKGEVDMVLAAIEETPERLEAADFSDPYYTDYPPMILVKAENTGNYKTLEDFDGKTVGAQTATTKATLVEEEMPGANLVALTTVTDLVNELVYDKCDAIVIDGAVAVQYAETNPDLVVSDVALGEAAPYCVAVQKDDPKGLLDSINATIAKLLDEGKIEEIIAFNDELSAKAIEG